MAAGELPTIEGRALARLGAELAAERLKVDALRAEVRRLRARLAALLGEDPDDRPEEAA